MKKYLNKRFLLSALSGRIRNEFFKGRVSYLRQFYAAEWLPQIRNVITKKFLLSSLLILFTFPAIAPDRDDFFIYDTPAIRPFEPLMQAIGMVETMRNVLAYNEREGAVGIFQIRQVKVDEYNRQTGDKLRLTDMFDYENSRKVFLHFASRAGPYNFEKIAKSWNGSGPMTEFYWSRIKSLL